jgi:Ni,Fe-hydrogenase III small subunit
VTVKGEAMANWVLKGLRTGVKSSSYPRRQDDTPGTSPGRPIETHNSAAAADALVARCPTQAITRANGGITVNLGRCIHCFRCQRNIGEQASWQPGYEWATQTGDVAAALNKLGSMFGRSLHVRFVDAGACGACISEARQLNNPYYNMHRLGFFITPSPRSADILLIAGPVSDAMRLPLRKTYEAMPTPKRVVAIGACAVSGGIFGPSFAASGGVAEIVPVDVIVPGCPPPPLAILHGLLVAVERKPPSAASSTAARATKAPA